MRDGEVPREIGLKLHEEVCSTWRALVDVRLKLLGLVPTVSVLALGCGFTDTDRASGQLGGRLVVGCLGFLFVLGLYVYDARNSALHDDRISRGRRLEHELGIHAGIFFEAT